MGHDKTTAPATSQLAISEDDDLDVVWPKIIRACNEEYNWNLDSRGPTKVDDVLAEFKPAKKEKAEIQDNAKMVFQKSLVIIERFGSIAAQGAGMVFGPSQQCFNAVSFVINAVQDYHEAMGNVTILMERVSAFLERLQEFLDQKKAEGRDTLAKPLRASVYRVLQHFLTILGIWHKLMNKKSGKFKLALKVVVFGEDGGVKSAMSKLELLVSDVTKTQINSIVVNLSAAARNIEALEQSLEKLNQTAERIEEGTKDANASLGRLENAEEEKKRLKEIRDTLSLKETRPWAERQDSLWSKHIDGTGRWLINDYNPFSHWAGSKEPVHSSVLSIKAAEGFGKSCLCSAVVNHLQTKYRGQSRVCVAYYYFQKDDFSSEKLSVNVALKSIIFQLASSTTSLGREYGKLVQRSCERKPDFGQTGELWKHLVVDITKNLEGTFFIILDGLDEAEAEPANPLAAILTSLLSHPSEEEESRFAIRMLLAGRATGLNALQGKVEEQTIPEISMTPGSDGKSPNEADILLYAQRRLENTDLFKRDSQPVKDLMERAKTALVNGARGDYYVLNIKLDQIEDCHSQQEVEAILETAAESREDITTREVERLNQTLTVAEIKEVNRLLVWVPVIFGESDIKMCEAILAPLWEETGLLGSLEKRIRSRYPELFDISKDSKVSIKDHILDYLATYLTKQGDDDESPSSKARNNKDAGPVFQETEIALIKRVVRVHFNNVFGDEDIWGKFAFEEYLDSKMPVNIDDANQRPLIRMGSYPDCHLQVLKTCMITICDQSEEKEPGPLFTYATQFFSNHIALINFDDIDAKTHQEIARQVVRVLREPSLIKIWLTTDQMINYRFGWLRDDNNLKSMYGMLKDPVVIKGLRSSPEDKDWVTANTSGDGPMVRILTEVAKQVAHQWYEHEDGRYSEFYWLTDYFSLLHGKTLQGWTPPPVQKILDMEKWGKEQAGVAGTEAKWHFCIAQSLDYCLHSKDAINRFHKAVESDPDNWKYRFGLTQALRNDDDLKNSIHHAEQLVQKNQASIEDKDDNDFKTAYWEEILLFLGQAYSSDKQFEKAEESYWSILKEAFQRNKFMDSAKEAISTLITSFNEQKKYGAVLELLQSLSDHPDQDTGLGTWMCVWFHARAEDSSVHNQIHKAIRNAPDQLAIVMDHYKTCIATAENSNEKFGTFIHLRHQMASLLWSHGGVEERQSALELWKDTLYMKIPEDVDKTMWAVEYARRATSAKLTQALLESAKTAGLGMPLNSATQSYADELERLDAFNQEENIVRWGNFSARLMLARLHHLAGNSSHAKDLVRNYLKAAVRQAGEKDEYWTGVQKVANTLKCFDQDENARAMWNLLEARYGMREEEEEEEEPKGHEADGITTVAANTEEPQATHSHANGSADPSSTTNGVEEQATAGAERLPDRNEGKAMTEVLTLQENNTASVEEANHSILSEKTNPEPVLGRFCEGECGLNWRALCKRSYYVCKDCCDICLEENCYQKLRSGSLAVCDPHHDFLTIPVFDIERLGKPPMEQMWVEDKSVSIKEWFEQIKKEWNLLPTPREKLVGGINKIIALNKLKKVSPSRGLVRRKTAAM